MSTNTAISTPTADPRFMEIAVRLAKRGLGTTAPNPSVGAVVVCPETQQILGQGWTQPGGRPHAEPVALERAGKASHGATLYVTLEPCSHYGKTPPCVESIIAAGVKRVVIGIKDPDPRVAGRSLNRLQEAGISVTCGVMRAECHWITRGHILRVTERRPFTQLKLALDKNGAAPRGHDGAPSWVTAPDARQHGHMLRAMADAITVGYGTLRDDNPSLTCRLPGLSHQSPERFILAGRSFEERDFTIFRDCLAPVHWVTQRGVHAPGQVLNAAINVIELEDVAGRIWLPAFMEELVARGITRLLVEGGPTIWRSFDRAGLVDEVILFMARDDKKKLNARKILSSYITRTSVQPVYHRALEKDDMFVFRRAM